MTDNVPEEKDKAYFRTDGDWLFGNGASRGPWFANACHGGPVTAAIARALEQLVHDKQLARLTVNYCRPVPLAGFRVVTEIIRGGRVATSAVATLRDSENRICASASSVHIMTMSLEGIPTATIPGPSFDEATTGDFSVKKAMHGLPFFGSSLEVAYPPGESANPGPTTMWVRALPIVEGEVSSPFQVICPISDCGNGMSRNAEYSKISFVNADITISAYRLPESDWLASQAVSLWQPSGIGHSQAVLFDKVGSIGMALQTLIIRPTV